MPGNSLDDSGNFSLTSNSPCSWADLDNSLIYVLFRIVGYEKGGNSGGNGRVVNGVPVK